MRESLQLQRFVVLLALDEENQLWVRSKHAMIGASEHSLGSPSTCCFRFQGRQGAACGARTPWVARERARGRWAAALCHPVGGHPRLFRPQAKTCDCMRLHGCIFLGSLAWWTWAAQPALRWTLRVTLQPVAGAAAAEWALALMGHLFHVRGGRVRAGRRQRRGGAAAELGHLFHCALWWR